MEARVPTVGPDQQKTKGTLWRFQGIFFEPSATFEDINRKPGFVVPLLVGMFVALVTWQVIGNLVNLQDLMMVSMKANPQVANNASPEQIQQQAKFMVPFIQYVTPLLMLPIMVFLISGVLMLMVWISGSETTFSKITSVVSYTLFLQGVVGGVLLILVFALASDPLAIDLKNPIMTNPGSLVDANDAPVLNRLLTSVDILVWYVIFLLGLGLSKIARPMTVARGIVLVAIPYLLYVAVSAGLAALF